MNEPGKLEVILLTGQSGVGKTTIAYEIAAILTAANIKHALIDTDELDRIYPAPPLPDEFSERTLRSVWNGFAELGCNKLILCAVLAGADDVPVWVKNALPDSQQIKMFRLRASSTAIIERLTKREIGSLLAQHLESSSKAVNQIAKINASIPIIETDGKSVNEIAREILQLAEWM